MSHPWHDFNLLTQVRKCFWFEPGILTAEEDDDEEEEEEEKKKKKKKKNM